jgi:hypothetical protein
MQQLLDTLNSHCGWECVVKSYDGWRLSVSSGSSVEYATPLATFAGVSYVSLPFDFSHPEFRLASSVEREQIGKVVPLEPEDVVFAIEADTMASFDRQVFFLVALSVELKAVEAASR